MPESEHKQSLDHLSVSRDALIEEMNNRATIYRLLGTFYLKPLTQEDLDNLSADMFLELSHDADDETESQGYNDIYRYLRRKNTATCQDLRTDFTQTFLGIKEYNGLSAVPYESTYLHFEGETMASMRLEVFRTFKRFNVKIEDNIEVPPDHLTFELEFISVLSLRCIQSLKEDDAIKTLENVVVMETFLERHLLSWFERFFNLANVISETRFYQGVLKVTKALLQEDAARLIQLRDALMPD